MSNIPVHLTAGLGEMLSPVLAIYYAGDNPDITLVGNVLTLTEGAVDIDIDLTGKSTTQVAGIISKASLPYSATVMTDVDDMSSVGITLSLADKTIDGGIILRADRHTVQQLESSRIRLLSPYNENREKPWYLRINRGWVTRVQGGVWKFAVPEYPKQTWSIKYGFGYMDVDDQPGERLGPRAIGVARTPIHWDRDNIFIKNKDRQLPSSVIKDVDIYNGIIYLDKDFEDNEELKVTYTYKEDSFVYTGIDLNPTEFHNPAVLDRYVLLYLLPFSGPDGIMRNSCVRHVESSTLTGAVQSIPNEGEPILLLGAAQVRHNQSKEEVQLTDTRTPGGGIKKSKWKDAVKKTREVLSSTDYGFYDGRPYAGNMAIFVTLPKELEDVLSKPEINARLTKFMAYGTYPIIEFK